MNNRERIKAILNYEKYDRMPLVYFGFWDETIEKWLQEGHITKEEAKLYFETDRKDGSEIEMK